MPLCVSAMVSMCSAIVMVRDDFWLAVEPVHARAGDPTLLKGRTVRWSIFSIRDHAGKCWRHSGGPSANFPTKSATLTSEQEDISGSVDRGLAEDGKVICVRLALFAEMMKAKAWTPATLKEVGGTKGVGVDIPRRDVQCRPRPRQNIAITRKRPARF